MEKIDVKARACRPISIDLEVVLARGKAES